MPIRDHLPASGTAATPCPGKRKGGEPQFDGRHRDVAFAPPGAAGFRKPDSGVAAHARSHGGGARMGCRKRCDPLQRLGEFVGRHWRDFERGDPAIAQNAAAHARERLDEQARKIRCRIDASNHAPRSFSPIVYGEQSPFGRLALAAGRPGAGHLHAISAQALAALTDSSAAPRVRLSRSFAGLARAERRTDMGGKPREAGHD
jgi:hypothetical protein